ncbi:hypothetical protein AURDEDRAFT_126202 [Auricularia subglabra TFB-10046 SS5]|nr:hypothetical protein AURDEDRAFT_126202 [Auricularia subglabra TFB-10046 SS5]
MERQTFVVTVQAYDSVLLKWDQDPLMGLPVELARRCLELLDFRSRILASHVSRAWRSVSLSNRTMWDLAVFSHATRHTAADVLAVMLARSAPLPFSFIWDEFNVDLPANLFNALLMNMRRMAEITVPGMDAASCRLLLSQKAPLMRTFVCDAARPGHLVLPALWGCGGAPQLRTLHLGNFCVPLYTPPRFPALRSFRGHLPAFVEGRIDNVHGSLYNIMPNLTSLDLLGITRTTLLYLMNPPACLEELRLQSDEPVIDYSALLGQCTSCALRVLDLSSAHSLSAAVHLFTRTTFGLWSMEVSDNDHHVALQSDIADARYEIHSAVKLSFLREHALLSEFERLEELTLSMSLLVDLYSMKAPGFTLPNLRSLTASLGRSNVAERMRDMDERRHPSARVPIHVPELLWMTIVVEDDPYAFQFCPLEHTIEWLSEELPRVLTMLLDAHYYEHVTISMGDAAQLVHHDLRALRRIAGCLIIEDRRRGELVQFERGAITDPHLRPDA